jgi:hypothetical protein
MEGTHVRTCEGTNFELCGLVAIVRVNGKIKLLGLLLLLRVALWSILLTGGLEICLQ